MKMQLWKRSVLFYLGGGAYMTLEFLWRGRSHGSMFLLGGLCFSLLGWLRGRMRSYSAGTRMFAGAAMVTTLELLTGLLVNRNYGVWDYRRLPLNFLGQISLLYSLLWLPVSLMGMLLYTAADKRIPGKSVGRSEP
jgi:hypothetical protein